LYLFTGGLSSDILRYRIYGTRRIIDAGKKAAFMNMVKQIIRIRKPKYICRKSMFPLSSHSCSGIPARIEDLALLFATGIMCHLQQE